MKSDRLMPLSSVCDIKMGQSPSSTSYNKDGKGIPFFQGNADFGAINPKVQYWCDQPIKIAKTNDILISVRAPIGAINIATEKCCIGRGLAALTIKGELGSNKYLYYALRNKASALISNGKGSTFKAINKRDLEDIYIPVPAKKIQNEIALALDFVQKLIFLRKKQVNTLNLLVKSRFIEMFGDPVTNPMGWEVKRLGEIFSIIDGDRGENYPKGEDFFNAEYCLFLNAGNVTSVGFDFTKNQFITKEKDLKLRKGRLIRGDIVITTRGTVGNIAFYDSTIPYDVIRINSGMVLLRGYVDFVEPFYFIQVVRSFNIMTQYLSGSAQPQLPISSMKNIPFILPPLALQNRFAEFVKQVDKSKFVMQKELEKLELAYKALMQQYFG